MAFSLSAHPLVRCRSAPGVANHVVIMQGNRRVCVVSWRVCRVLSPPAGCLLACMCGFPQSFVRAHCALQS